MIIGICGGTGSGKTTLAKKIVEHFGSENVSRIEQDSYYFNLADIPLDERRKANFDHPEAVDFEAIGTHLSKLRTGEEVEIPIYDFASHTRKDETRLVKPTPIVILEGILIFSQPEIVELIDLKVFIDTPEETRLERRIERDIEERGRTLDHTLWQYEKTIQPMHKEFVEPSKDVADFVLADDGEEENTFSRLVELIEGRSATGKI